MSFIGFKSTVEENDIAMLYLDPKSIYPVHVVPRVLSKKGTTMIDNIIQTKYGSVKVMDLVGKKYGHKFTLSQGWGYLLHPSPELWTLTLPHRTQILYTPDISVITMQLDLRPGAIVIESGTGSGSLSHAIARTIAPGGHLHTFDFHQQRVDIARKEFEEHGLENVVTIQQRDVCKDGFGLTDRADAVFLDLPCPWLAVEHAALALKKRGGRICSFSPCIEQTQRAAEALSSAGFVSIETIECLQREFQVKNIFMHEADLFNDVSQQDGSADEKPKSFRAVIPPTQMAGHTGYLTFASWPAQTESA